MIVAPTFDVERALFARGICTLAALDEVGRGALAGPVSVGAVLIDSSVGPPPDGLRDSKLLSAAARTRLAPLIVTWVGNWSVGHASPAEIDQWGIMTALTLAARRALAGLCARFDAVLLDGTIDYVSLPTPLGFDRTDPAIADGANGVILSPTAVTTRAKADRDCASVSAASVLAKVTRDALMVAAGAEYPQYQWARNKGYGTGAHAEALAQYGPCDSHRRSWHLPERRVAAPTSI
ncbi:MAG: ribonuclease HII [Nakamurella sp.]